MKSRKKTVNICYHSIAENSKKWGKIEKGHNRSNVPLKSGNYLILFGGTEGDRTDDLMTTSHVVFDLKSSFPAIICYQIYLQPGKNGPMSLLPEIQLFRINLKKLSYSVRHAHLGKKLSPSQFLMESCDTSGSRAKSL